MIKPKSKLRFFPLRDTFSDYSWEKWKADLYAGMNVALLDLPQGMAYALLAGFPVTFGIYASAIACLLGPFLASSRYVILGPSNATAVLILSSFMALELTGEEKLAALPVLLCMVGIFLIIGAFFRLASLVKYVSRTVSTAYVSAAALLIIINQMDTILGLPSVHAATFFEVLRANVAEWGSVQWESLLMVGVTLVSYFGLKRFFPKLPTIVCVLVFGGLIAFVLNRQGMFVEMLDGVPLGTWPLSFPDFSFERISQLGGAAMALAFLALLESSSISKNLAARKGDRVDLNQHMLSLGVANLGAAFGSGIAVSGSLTRSELNAASGARTSVSSLVSGALLVFGALCVGPVLAYIPKPVLATIVVLVGVSLIKFDQIMVFIRSTRSDALIFGVTFVGGLLFPLNVAIYLGAAASIILFLQKISEPKLVEYFFTSTGEIAEKREGEESGTPEISIVHVEGELFFGSTDIFLDQTRLICESPNLKVIILKIRNANQLDATSALAIKDLIRFAQEKGRVLLVCGADKQVESVFNKSGAMELLGKENFFKYSRRKPNKCTADSLKRAQQIIGQDKANIILYTSESEDHKGC